MNEHQKGMILLITLLMLGLIAAFVLSMQKAMWLYAKLYQQTTEMHVVFEALETTAFQLAKQAFHASNKRCLSEVSDVNDALFRLKAGYGCRITDHKIRYQYWMSLLNDADKHMVLAVRATSHPGLILSLRFSKSRGLMAWRMIYS